MNHYRFAELRAFDQSPLSNVIVTDRHTSTGFLISNTNEMISKGVEIETMWNISEGVFLTFGTTYADASYGDSQNIEGVTEADLFFAQDYITLEDWDSLQNIEGRQITHAPYWQSSLSLYVERSVTSNLIGYRNLNVGNRGEHNTGSDLKNAKDVSGEELVNLQPGLCSQGDRWNTQLWARNLTDNPIKTLVFNSACQSGSFSTFLAPPRLVGITLCTNW